MGKSVQKVGAIMGVATIALAAFVAGRMSSTSLDRAAFERAYASCVESVDLEYRDTIKGEFRQTQRRGKPSIAPCLRRYARQCIGSTSRPIMKATWSG